MTFTRPEFEPIFLVLAPVNGTQIPSSRASSSANSTPASEISEPAALASASRRSSNNFDGFRFLKLGPVYFGGQPGQLDYVDV